ncbi:hypothetical protein AOLI_G00046240 [Acnodon oligacanthus]
MQIESRGLDDQRVLEISHDEENQQQLCSESFLHETRNRTYLLCPLCKKTQWSLPVHLRRSCMKNSPGVDIERTVDAAKREVNELLHRGRVWEHDLIRKILDNPDPVGRIEGMLWSTSPPKDPAPAIPAIQPAACSPSAGPAQANSEAGSKSSRELYHWWVESVGRFMYYMDHKRPSLLFVRQQEKTREYSNKLSEAGLCKQTVQFYVKSVKSSMLGAPASALKTVLHKDSNNYVLFLSNLQASASKQVIEWVQRKRVPGHGGHVVVGVKEHNICKTGGHLYSLPGGGDGKILDWFDLYFTEVRPVMLGEKRKHMEDETDESEERFISSTGSSIYNASNDLERLHRKYQMPKVTSQMARRAFEMATKKMTDTEKSMVADYFTHSSATAENVVTASLLLKRLLSGLDSSEERGVCTGSGCSQLEDQAAHHLLVKSYTLMVDGAAPKRSVRATLTGVHERCYYDHWRSEQLQLHMQHVLEHFGRRLPSEDRVRSRDGLQTFQMQPLFSGRGSHLGGPNIALDSSVVKRLTRTQK